MDGVFSIQMLKEASLPTFEGLSVNLADSTQLCQQVKECTIKKFKKSWFTLINLQTYPLKVKKGGSSSLSGNVYFNASSKTIQQINTKLISCISFQDHIYSLCLLSYSKISHLSGSTLTWSESLHSHVYEVVLELRDAILLCNIRTDLAGCVFNHC